MVQAGAAAASHALLVVSAEQALGLFRERAVQDAIIGNDTVTDAFNAYYGGTHFLIPTLVLAWLMFRHPAHYGRARTALAVITGLAFIVLLALPGGAAPAAARPLRDHRHAGGAAPGSIDSALISAAGDQYASMPSVHVAWAVWCALAIYPVARHWAVRALAVAYPLVTMLVVVATGNHYFLDVIAGALLACVTWVAVTRIGSWLAVRIATRRRGRPRTRASPRGGVPGSCPGGLPEDRAALPAPPTARRRTGCATGRKSDRRVTSNPVRISAHAGLTRARGDRRPAGVPRRTDGEAPTMSSSMSAAPRMPSWWPSMTRRTRQGRAGRAAGIRAAVRSGRRTKCRRSRTSSPLIKGRARAHLDLKETATRTSWFGWRSTSSAPASSSSPRPRMPRSPSSGPASPPRRTCRWR